MQVNGMSVLSLFIGLLLGTGLGIVVAQVMPTRADAASAKASTADGVRATGRTCFWGGDVIALLGSPCLRVMRACVLACCLLPVLCRFNAVPPVSCVPCTHGVSRAEG